MSPSDEAHSIARIKAEYGNEQQLEKLREGAGPGQMIKSILDAG